MPQQPIGTKRIDRHTYTKTFPKGYLCSNLKSPVPIFIGIPMIIHSLTPRKGIAILMKISIEFSVLLEDHDFNSSAVQLWYKHINNRTNHAMIVIISIPTRHYISLTMVCSLKEMVSSLFKLK